MRTNRALEALRGLALPDDETGSLVDFYGSRTPAQEERIAEEAMALRRAGNKGGDELLRYLAAFGAGAGMRAVYPSLLSERVLHPALLWRFAGDEAVPHLADLLGSHSLETDHALQALAWCRSPASIALFASWWRTPPAWSSLLHWAPHLYTTTAGWTLTAHGAVRQLYSDRCVPLRVVAEGEQATHQAWSEIQEPCGFCGRPMVALLPGGAAQDAVDVATCFVCTCFAYVFSRQGTTRWASENQRPKRVPPRSEEWERSTCALVVGSARPPLAAVDELLPVSASQIGGAPTWVEDPEYPSCPCCAELMTFVAQLDQADLEKRNEGIYYAFRCETCGLAATSYQQS